MYRNETDFCILILYPAILLNLFISFNSFLAVSSGFSIYNISSASRDSSTSSFLIWFFNFLNLFLFEKNRLTSLLLWGRGSLRSSWLAGLLPLHRHRLLAAQNGTGSAGGSQAPIRAVLVLLDHVPDAAEGGPGVLVDGGPQMGGRLSRAGSPLHHYHDPFAICRRLHTHSLAVNEPVVAEGVAGL